MFQAVAYRHLQRRLNEPSCVTIWARGGVQRPSDGDGHGDVSHAVRHWYASLARSRGISDEVLARLQRRKNPLQNRHYVHLPDGDIGGLAARTAAVLAVGLDPRDALPPPASAPTLAAHAAALLRAQGLGTNHAG